MTQVNTSEHKADGNTSSSARCRNWCYTLNNPTENEIAQITLLKCHKHVCQIEEGKEGTPHLQGVIVFKNARSFTATKKLLGQRSHIEKCRNLKDSIQYCSKTEGRIRTVMTKGLPQQPQVVRNLRLWQALVKKKLLSEPNDREIVWIWDKKGGAGKTQFCKHMVVKHNALYLSGKASDMKYCITQYIEKTKNINGLILLLDFSRSIENYVSYQGIEEIKNGIFFNNKYESGMCIYNTPHVVCFANFKPDVTKLSADRWNIMKLD